MHDERYRRSGGRASLHEYFSSHGGLAEVRPLLRERIVFAQHDLASDGSPRECQLILCTGHLARLGRVLQRRAFSVFHASLCPFGYLAVSRGESLTQHPERASYEHLPGGTVWRRLL